MKRLLVLVFVLFFLGGAGLFAAEFELGMSITPVTGDMTRDSEEVETDGMPGLHAGYAFFGVLYVSLDALVAPPSMVAGMTGFYRPGFINLFDAGIRLKLGPIVLLTTAGINNLYVHDQENLDGDWESDLGANLRAGFGLRTDFVGVTVTATQLFNSFDGVVSTVSGLFDDARRDNSVARLIEGFIPSLMVVLYL